MLALLAFTFLLKSMDLKEVLAPSKFRLSSAVNQTVNKGGCFKCDKNRCDLCKNFLLHASKFRSSATEKMTVDIIHNLLICIRVPFWNPIVKPSHTLYQEFVSRKTMYRLRCFAIILKVLL